MGDDFSLGSVLDQAPQVVCKETFGEGDLRFTVEVRRVSLRELKDMRDRCKKIVFEQHEKKETVDQEKLRGLLAEKCLVSWDGLTAGIACAMSARECPPDVAKTVVPPTQANKVTMLSFARAEVDGRPMAFEDWLWERMNAVAKDRAEAESAEKKI